MAKVTLLINNKVAETRIFPSRHLHIEGYLEGLKKDILENNEEVMDLSQTEIAFTVEVTPALVHRGIPN